MSAAIAIQAGASILGGIFGSRAASKQAKQARIIGEYNAKVARINAQAQSDALKSQSRSLIKSQREFQAQQRMSIAGRGGLETAGDLLSLINSAKTMQLDLLELKRQQDIAIIGGEVEAQQIKMGAEAQAQRLKAEGKGAMMGGILGAAGAVATGFADGTLSFGSKGINANATLTPSLNTTLGRSNSFVTRAMNTSLGRY